MKAFIYWNLHKNVWSVKALDGPKKGKVVAHAKTLLIENAEFKVSERGRQRVIKERSKNVHAGVVGTVVAMDAIFDVSHSDTQVSYNPYKSDTFYTVPNGYGVSHAEMVYMGLTKDYYTKSVPKPIVTCQNVTYNNKKLSIAS
jgi:hypothetical protein